MIFFLGLFGVIMLLISIGNDTRTKQQNEINNNAAKYADNIYHTEEEQGILGVCGGYPLIRYWLIMDNDDIYPEFDRYIEEHFGDIVNWDNLKHNIKYLLEWHLHGFDQHGYPGHRNTDYGDLYYIEQVANGCLCGLFDEWIRVKRDMRPSRILNTWSSPGDNLINNHSAMMIDYLKELIAIYPREGVVNNNGRSDPDYPRPAKW